MHFREFADMRPAEPIEVGETGEAHLNPYEVMVGESEPTTLPVVQSNDPHADLSNPENRDAINLQLFDVVDSTFITPEALYVAISDILDNNGYSLPYGIQDSEEGLPSEGEDICAFLNADGTPQCYLYVCYSQSESGYYECHAEIVTEDELNEILSSDLGHENY